MIARRTKPRARIALNFYLMTLASVISVAVFVACVFQTFVMGRDYQMTLTQGVVNSFASKISELAYADDVMWRFQEERIAALFEHVKGESNTGGHEWSVSVETADGASVFQRHAEPAFLQTSAHGDIRVGAELIGHVYLTSEDYELAASLMRQGSIALTISLSIFILLLTIPFRALRKRDLELQVALREAQEGNRSKREFISTVSHELRTPLTSIKGSLDLLGSGLIGDFGPLAQRSIDIAVRNSTLLGMLVNDILDYEKLDAGKMAIDPIVDDIVSVVGNAVEVFGTYGAARQIKVRSIGNNGPMLYLIDTKRITQVLGNLISNAVKFSPPNEVVTVSVCEVDGWVRVAVKDNGCGVPEKDRKIIFEAFSQGDSSDTRSYGGTGLGLTISQAIVEKHGGQIHLTQNNEKGSTFYFDLPRVECLRTPQAPQAVKVAA